jgi:hypothetical protein
VNIAKPVKCSFNWFRFVLSPPVRPVPGVGPFGVESKLGESAHAEAPPLSKPALIKTDVPFRAFLIANGLVKSVCRDTRAQSSSEIFGASLGQSVVHGDRTSRNQASTPVDPSGCPNFRPTARS